jgi:hypothetical protein
MKNYLLILNILILFSCSYNKYEGCYIDKNYNTLYLYKEKNNYYIDKFIYYGGNNFDPLPVEIKNEKGKIYIYERYTKYKLLEKNNQKEIIDYPDTDDEVHYMKFHNKLTLSERNLFKEKYKKLNFVFSELNGVFISNKNKIYYFFTNIEKYKVKEIIFDKNYKINKIRDGDIEYKDKEAFLVIDGQSKQIPLKDEIISKFHIQTQSDYKINDNIIQKKYNYSDLHIEKTKGLYKTQNQLIDYYRNSIILKTIKGYLIYYIKDGYYEAIPRFYGGGPDIDSISIILETNDELFISIINKKTVYTDFQNGVSEIFNNYSYIVNYKIFF